MADINILMVGGRRTGKSSMLAAMDKCCDEKLGDMEGVEVICTSGSTMLMEKISELQNYFVLDQYKEQNTFRPDDTPSDNNAEYEYEIRLNERATGFTLRFNDAPGEAYDKPEDKEKVEKWVRNSQVLLIAIDTPHLLEEPDEVTEIGSGHKFFNRPDEITRFIKTAFTTSKQHRMVLFVPMKCEKYYYTNKMAKVNEAVRRGYSDLFRHLQSSEVKEMCTVAITPILTIGGAQFFTFGGDVRNIGQYRYLKGDMRKYAPQYCEQPMLMVLRYVLSVAEASKKNQNPLMKWYLEKLRKRASMKDLQENKKDIEDHIIMDKDLGFEVIQDPLR